MGERKKTIKCAQTPAFNSRSMFVTYSALGSKNLIVSLGPPQAKLEYKSQTVIKLKGYMEMKVG